MLVIPAIDLRGGRCVRLRQGDYAQEIVFSDDPVIVACRWVEEGAQYLHLVDLDGAKEGRPINTKTIAAIVQKANVPCQLGGGLRDLLAIESALVLGVERVIIGTQAVRDPEWFSQMAERFPKKLVLGLDARNGKVAVEGWLGSSEQSVLELAQRYDPLPLAAIVYTDIMKDGMMNGPNFLATEELARQSSHLVIASGGVTTEADVLELARRGIGACILGRSLYEGRIKLPDLLRHIAEGIHNKDS